MLLVPGVMATMAVPAHAVTGDVTVNLPAAYGSGYVAAASGSALVAFPNALEKRSTDNGVTWVDSDFPQYPRGAVADGFATTWEDEVEAGGQLVSELSVHSMADGTATDYTVSQPDQDYPYILGANASYAVNGGLEVVQLATGDSNTPAWQEFPWPTDYDEWWTWVEFAPNSERIATVDWVQPNTGLYYGWIDVAARDGSSASIAPFKVTGLAAVRLTNTAVEYVVESATELKVCRRPLPSGSTSCVVAATGDFSQVTVGKQATDTAWLLDSSKGVFLVEGGVSRKVTLPAGTLDRDAAVLGDPTRPLLGITTASAPAAVYQVKTGGTLSKLFEWPDTLAVPGALALTADRLYGQDERPTSKLLGDQAWVRSVGDTIGPETLLPSRASETKASAARMVTNTLTGVEIYDAGVKQRTLTQKASILSEVGGPYILLSEYDSTAGGYVKRVRTVRGTLVPTSAPVALWGSLVVEESGAGYVVRDLSGVTAAVPFNPAEVADRVALWGDLLAVGYDDEATETPMTAVYNYRTGARLAEQQGRVQDLGDGVAALNNDSGLAIWQLAANTVTQLDGADLSAVSIGDDGRIAYATDTQLVLTGPKAATQGPRLLGALAASTFAPAAGQSWGLELDVTKPLAAGTLEIKSGADTVRTLALPATASGSLRGISWNGRNEADQLVGPGSYSYTLTAAAADGSGAVRGPDGVAAAGGTVQVIGDPVAAVISATPKVSDTTPTVDQQLTALEGAWGPDATLIDFSYQWYAGSTPIAGATAKTYVVRAADVGKQLKVAVTGSRPAYTPATRTSVLTSAVAKASLTPTPTPTITGTLVVDQVVTANPGVWGPAPVDSTSYQWYKVSSGGTTYTLTGATAATYRIKGTDAGYKLKVKVTVAKAGYTTVSKTSAKTATYVAKATFLKPHPVPTISVDGTPRVGKPMTAVPGDWSPTPTSFGYQWYRGTTLVSSKASYTPTSYDLGKRLLVKVRALRSGFVTTTYVASAPTAVVESGLKSPATPVLSDTTPKSGDVLTVKNAVCDPTAPNGNPISRTYQWYQGSTAIAGATDASFEVRSVDVGKTVKVKVTCSAADYAALAKTSASSSTVVKGSALTVLVKPWITGVSHAGTPLTAHEGTWSAPPDSYTYQWYAQGTAIAGATSNTYIIDPGNMGQAITVKVTAIKAGYAPTSVMSETFYLTIG